MDMVINYDIPTNSKVSVAVCHPSLGLDLIYGIAMALNHPRLLRLNILVLLQLAVHANLNHFLILSCTFL